MGVAESILAYALYIVVLEEEREREAALNLRILFVRVVRVAGVFFTCRWSTRRLSGRGTGMSSNLLFDRYRN